MHALVQLVLKASTAKPTLTTAVLQTPWPAKTPRVSMVVSVLTAWKAIAACAQWVLLDLRAQRG
jgi:hypothetical protein